MADIELVIKIPEEDYEGLKRKDKFNDMYVNYYEKLIVHGTPLPKGHGRLIDADELIKQLEVTANIEWNQQVGSSKGLRDAIDIADDAPIIVVEDKESEV